MNMEIKDLADADSELQNLGPLFNAAYIDLINGETNSAIALMTVFSDRFGDFIVAIDKTYNRPSAA